MSRNYCITDFVHGLNFRLKHKNLGEMILIFRFQKIKTFSSGSFYYHAIKNWNSLPDDIKSTSQKTVLKKMLKLTF